MSIFRAPRNAINNFIKQFPVKYNEENCGKLDANREKRSLKPLIFGSENVDWKKFPWVVKIHVKNKICSGTLISKSAIITAAHCIKKTHYKEIIIELFNNKNASIWGYFRHYLQNQHVDDIALLYLGEDVSDAEFVPVCVSTKIPKTSEGMLISFGLDEIDRIGNIQGLEMIAIANRECRLSNLAFVEALQNSHFCGGSTTTGTGPCKGDSGGGFIFKENDTWYLRGILSSSLEDFEGKCDVDNYSIFIDILYYLRWIPTGVSSCERSITTASGTRAPKEICIGDLIFEENFNDFDLKTWEHRLENGGIENTFSSFVNNRSSTYVDNGILYLGPSFSNDPQNPVHTALIETQESFSFKYGTLEIRAKAARGDWLRSHIHLWPKNDLYGATKAPLLTLMLLWLHGNTIYFDQNYDPLGSNHMKQMVEYGIDGKVRMKGWSIVNFTYGFDEDFHLYQLKWTPDEITLNVDNEPEPFKLEKYNFRKDFEGSNIWTESKEIMAPFDQEFYIAIAMLVGGPKAFPDEAFNIHGKKPWKNSDLDTMKDDFWKGRRQWLRTWDVKRNSSRDGFLQIDYIKVWAL